MGPPATGGRDRDATVGRRSLSADAREVRVDIRAASTSPISSSVSGSCAASWTCPRSASSATRTAERDADPTLVIGWAGWDHLQQAKALAAYYVQHEGVGRLDAERLTPLLAGLLELLPWLKQWHNEIDPAYGSGMGDYFAGFVDEEARALGLTLRDDPSLDSRQPDTARRRAEGHSRRMPR